MFNSSTVVIAGETLLSPLVQCGPKGLRFLKPVELYLPHDISRHSGKWNVSLKTTNESGQWKQIDLPDTNVHTITHNSEPQTAKQQAFDNLR